MFLSGRYSGVDLLGQGLVRGQLYWVNANLVFKAALLGRLAGLGF